MFDDRYCCLGVLCDLAVKHGVIPEPSRSDGYFVYEGEACQLPKAVCNWAGLNSIAGSFREGPGSLVTLNDSGNYSFQQIATIIDTTPLR